MNVLSYISSAAIPGVIILIVLFGLFQKVKVFDAFAEGAKEGITTTIRIIPPLIGLIVAVGVLRESGALDLFVKGMSFVFAPIGVPSEILSLALIRPISGNAAMAAVVDIMKTFGADSYIGLVACTIMGSTETIFYTLTIYFGSVGIRKIKYTLYAALLADAVGLVAAVYLWRLMG